MAAKAGSAPSAKGPVGYDDNEPIGLTKEQREDLLLVHLAHARQDAAALERAMEGVRAVRKLRNRRRNDARTDGFSLKILDEILEDEAKDRTLLEAEAELRTFMRSTAKVPVIGKNQQDLFSFDGPTTSKGDASLDQDDADWRGRGYAVGMRGGDAVLPEGIPSEHAQAWLAGRMDGQERLAKGMKSYKEMEKKRKAPGAAAPKAAPPAAAVTPKEPAPAEPDEPKPDNQDGGAEAPVPELEPAA